MTNFFLYIVISQDDELLKLSISNYCYYFVIAPFEFEDLFLNLDLKLEKYRQSKMYLYLIHNNFNINGIQKYYHESQYFMKEIASLVDDPFEYRIFPIIEEKFKSYLSYFDGPDKLNKFEGFNSWENIEQYIDFKQMRKSKISLQNYLYKYFLLHFKLDNVYTILDQKIKYMVARIPSITDPIKHILLDSIVQYISVDENEKTDKSFQSISLEEKDKIEKFYEELYKSRYIKSELNDQEIFYVKSFFTITNINSFTIKATEAYISELTIQTFTTIRFVSSILRFAFQGYILKKHYPILMDKLNIDSKNNNFIYTAFTHVTSSGYIPNRINNYEALEFLGDSIMSLFVAEALIKSTMNENNEFYTIHQNYVKNLNLMEIAEKRGFNDAIWASSFIQKNKISSDVVEAIIGALVFEIVNNKYNEIQKDSKVNLSLGDVKKFCNTIIYPDLIENQRFPIFNIKSEIKIGLLKLQEALGFDFKENIYLLLQALFDPKHKSNNFFDNCIEDGIISYSIHFNNNQLNWLGSILRMAIFAINTYSRNRENLLPKQMDYISHSIQKTNLPIEVQEILINKPFEFSEERINSLQNAICGAVYLVDPTFYIFFDSDKPIIDINNKLISKTNDINSIFKDENLKI